MNDLLLSWYHRLPPTARSAAATLRGFYLRSWRSGPASPALEREARERESWTADRWREWREEQVPRLLHRAATQVPFYRAQWTDRRRRGDRSSWERLEHWPILEKDALRADPRAFLADDRPLRMFEENTSGTSGKPLRLWRSQRTVETLYATVAVRSLDWFRIPRQARYARLGGQVVTPVSQRRPPFWVWNAAMRQLYMSVYHLAPDLIPYYLDALIQYRIHYLQGYSNSLAAVAREALRLGYDLPMAVAITNSEPVTPEQREVIGRAFQCPVQETYGMAEMVTMASECRAGRLHLWPEIGQIEVVGPDGPAPPGESGDFICTGLLNTDMPLIRYRVGDTGRLDPDESPCACGVRLPALAAIDGRATDLVVTRDGRRVYWLNPVFYGLPIRESQIVQETLDRLVVRLAPEPGFSDTHAGTVVSRLRQRIGDVDVRLEYVEMIPRTSNGKVRAVVCEVGPAPVDSEKHAVGG